jgi:hypothetical protein
MNTEERRRRERIDDVWLQGEPSPAAWGMWQWINYLRSMWFASGREPDVETLDAEGP